ncbi:MAG TPA: Ig-like domain-containing protein, partial [Polyangiales bacterium]|nr:Ig-like domain-containing protein [Polyangiales bacterium]
MRSQFGVGARRRAVRSLLLLAVAACSGSSGPANAPDAAAYRGDGGSSPDAGSDAQTLDDAGKPLARLLIEPSNKQLTLGLDTPETLQFTAHISTSGDSALGVKWTADHPELGAIDRNTGVFTPTGIAGSITVYATAGTLQSKTRLTIHVAAQQQGDPDASSTPGGAGGLGGVGGDGGGTKLEDPQLIAALDAPATLDPDLKWLYPYDGTVWPRGLPAPLLQWSSQVPARAVKIHIEVDDVFRYDGYFGAPAGLKAGQPIKRLPIPQKAWKIAQESGAKLKIRLTIAASDGST